MSRSLSAGQYGSAGPACHAETVLFCAGGGRSALAAKALLNMGLHRVAHPLVLADVPMR